VTAPAPTWLSVSAPFTRDENLNSYCKYELGLSQDGPFETAAAIFPYLSGSSEWRQNVLANGKVQPGQLYYVRVTYFDSDGVEGDAQQIVAVTTPSSGSNAVKVGVPKVEVKETEIFVSLDIQEDANLNSGGVIDIATSPNGSWERRVYSLPFHAKRGRIRSLTPGVEYYVRVTVADPDGVNGEAVQVVGPIKYSGQQNLAFGKSVLAEPGWGCCSNPQSAVSGVLQFPSWPYGHAWKGGNNRWAGGSPGIKYMTVDLGESKEFNRVVAFYHDPGNVPLVWGIQYSDDLANWRDAYSSNTPVSRTETLMMPGAWYYPAGYHEADFPTVKARYVRYSFDDTTLFDGIHGWITQMEVFQIPK
jgi:hypothetical protein